MDTQVALGRHTRVSASCMDSRTLGDATGMEQAWSDAPTHTGTLADVATRLRDEEIVKRDRTARLLGVANLLYQHPHGHTAQEIGDRIGMNVRTVYRDLHALEDVRLLTSAPVRQPR